MFDVITFGSAAQDIYLKSKKFLPVFNKTLTAKQGICLDLGSKIEVEDIFLSSGGGGTNTAATFANQGLKVAWCGQVGEDCFGNLIIAELKKLKISPSFILKTKNKLTNISVFLTYPGKDRTILVYRGASDDLEKKDIPWQKIKKTSWFYLAPFSGKLANLTEDLINFAQKFKIKVAWNPGYDQLKFSKPVLERILKKIDILILNQEEASLLTKIPFQKPARRDPCFAGRQIGSGGLGCRILGPGREKEIFRKIDEMTKGIAIMTKGRDGVVVSDGKELYQAPSLRLKFVDATGAGDAFGSGFVAGMIEKNNIIFAIQKAMANSGFCVSQWGAQKGLLKSGARYPKIKILKKRL